MARIAGVNIPQNKVVHVALTYIHGIGNKFSSNICTKLNISRNRKANSLTEEEVLKNQTFRQVLMDCQLRVLRYLE